MLGGTFKLSPLATSPCCGCLWCEEDASVPAWAQSSEAATHSSCGDTSDTREQALGSNLDPQRLCWLHLAGDVASVSLGFLLCKMG